LQAVETVGHLSRGEAVFVGHHDELHEHQEDAGLEQKVVPETREEQGGDEQDEGDEDD